jgi:FkbM family methyltransferase
LYYIDTAVANEMNGNDLINNWAHGQGSFDEAIVKHWIKKNSFRGKSYRKNMNHYLNSILEISVDMIRLDSIMPSHPNLLLCIDAQGAELDILQSLGEKLKPRYIVVEDDIGNGREVANYIESLGYSFKGGGSDKVYELSGAYLEPH